MTALKLSEKHKPRSVKRKQYKNKHEQDKRISVTSEMIEEDLLREGRALKIAPETIQLIAARVIPKVLKWAERRTIVTQDDVERKLAAELQAYNEDLAYVYKNRGKII